MLLSPKYVQDNVQVTKIAKLWSGDLVLWSWGKPGSNDYGSRLKIESSCM